MAKSTKTTSKNIQWNGDNIEEVKKYLKGVNVTARKGDKLQISTKKMIAVVQKGDYITKDGDTITASSNKE